MTPYYSDDLVTIYHGDCREIIPMLAGGLASPQDRVGSSLEPFVPESGLAVTATSQLPQIGLLLTDPPYGLNVEYGERGRRRRAIAGDSDTALLSWVAAQSQWLAPDAWSAVFCGWNGSSAVMDAMTDAGLGIKTLIVWDKMRPGQGYGVRDQHEFVVLGRQGNPPRPWSGGNVWRYPPVYAPDHPTQKPIALMRALVGRLLSEPTVVLDPFMGSGPTLEAAKSLGHRAIGIEIEERYCEIAATRCSQEVLGLVG